MLQLKGRLKLLRHTLDNIEMRDASYCAGFPTQFILCLKAAPLKYSQCCTNIEIHRCGNRDYHKAA